MALLLLVYGIEHFLMSHPVKGKTVSLKPRNGHNEKVTVTTQSVS